MARRRGICPWTRRVLDPNLNESGLLAAKRKATISENLTMISLSLNKKGNRKCEGTPCSVLYHIKHTYA